MHSHNIYSPDPLRGVSWLTSITVPDAGCGIYKEPVNRELLRALTPQKERQLDGQAVDADNWLN